MTAVAYFEPPETLRELQADEGAALRSWRDARECDVCGLLVWHEFSATPPARHDDCDAQRLAVAA